MNTSDNGSWPASPSGGSGEVSNTAPAPEYVLIGHVTRDVAGSGFVPGGTVTYAGLTARALGRRVAVVTSAGPELDLAEVLPGLMVSVAAANATTTFENVYRQGKRQQWIRAVAAPLPLDQVPIPWRGAPILHFAPLTGEFDADLVLALRSANFLGLTPQGWMRRWDASGRVQRAPWTEPEAVLAACDAVVLSEEDVEGDWETCERWAEIAKLLVVTVGDRGCVVFERGRPWRVPAFPTNEIDATGAGDVFAAAFFINLVDQGDPLAAARYANCVASFAVEGPGTTAVPTGAQVAARLAEHHLPLKAE